MEGKTIDEIIEPLYKETILNLRGERFYGQVVLSIQSGKLGHYQTQETHKKKGGDTSEQ